MCELGNLFADIPADAPRELLETLLDTPALRIERIISYGKAPPDWFDQEMHEWVVLIRGAARLRFEGQEPIEMAAGAFLNIPAHQRHRVEWTSADALWLAVHYQAQPAASPNR